MTALVASERKIPIPRGLMADIPQSPVISFVLYTVYIIPGMLFADDTLIYTHYFYILVTLLTVT